MSTGRGVHASRSAPSVVVQQARCSELRSFWITISCFPYQSSNLQRRRGEARTSTGDRLDLARTCRRAAHWGWFQATFAVLEMAFRDGSVVCALCLPHVPRTGQHGGARDASHSATDVRYKRIRVLPSLRLVHVESTTSSATFFRSDSIPTPLPAPGRALGMLLSQLPSLALALAATASALPFHGALGDRSLLGLNLDLGSLLPPTVCDTLAGLLGGTDLCTALPNITLVVPDLPLAKRELGIELDGNPALEQERDAVIGHLALRAPDDAALASNVERDLAASADLLERDLVELSLLERDLLSLDLGSLIPASVCELIEGLLGPICDALPNMTLPDLSTRSLPRQPTEAQRRKRGLLSLDVGSLIPASVCSLLDSLLGLDCSILSLEIPDLPLAGASADASADADAGGASAGAGASSDAREAAKVPQGAVWIEAMDKMPTSGKSRPLTIELPSSQARKAKARVEVMAMPPTADA